MLVEHTPDTTAYRVHLPQFNHGIRQHFVPVILFRGVVFKHTPDAVGDETAKIAENEPVFLFHHIYHAIAPIILVGNGVVQGLAYDEWVISVKFLWNQGEEGRIHVAVFEVTYFMVHFLCCQDQRTCFDGEITFVASGILINPPDACHGR